MKFLAGNVLKIAVLLEKEFEFKYPHQQCVIHTQYVTFKFQNDNVGNF